MILCSLIHMADTTMSTYNTLTGFCRYSVPRFQRLFLSQTTLFCTDLKVSLMHCLQTNINSCVLMTVYLHFSQKHWQMYSLNIVIIRLMSQVGCRDQRQRTKINMTCINQMEKSLEMQAFLKLNKKTAWHEIRDINILFSFVWKWTMRIEPCQQKLK